MRRAVAVLLFVLPTAAAAQPAPQVTIDPAQAAAALQNPLVQDGLARTVTRLAGIVLDTRVGPLATLADPGDDIRPGDTLRDLKHRDDPQFERHLDDSTRRAVATAGLVAGGVASEGAELQRTADRLRTALAPLLAALAPREDEAPARRP